jgi:hypothetical protein
MPTVSLRRFTTPPLALDVRPLARLRDGLVEPAAAAFLPRDGPCALVLWTPGPTEPAFALVEGALAREGRGWRLAAADAPRDAWVVLWAAR